MPSITHNYSNNFLSPSPPLPTQHLNSHRRPSRNFPDPRRRNRIIPSTAIRAGLETRPIPRSSITPTPTTNIHPLLLLLLLPVRLIDPRITTTHAPHPPDHHSTPLPSTPRPEPSVNHHTLQPPPSPRQRLLLRRRRARRRTPAPRRATAHPSLAPARRPPRARPWAFPPARCCPNRRRPWAPPGRRPRPPRAAARALQSCPAGPSLRALLPTSALPNARGPARGAPVAMRTRPSRVEHVRVRPYSLLCHPQPMLTLCDRTANANPACKQRGLYFFVCVCVVSSFLVLSLSACASPTPAHAITTPDTRSIMTKFEPACQYIPQRRQTYIALAPQRHHNHTHPRPRVSLIIALSACSQSREHTIPALPFTQLPCPLPLLDYSCHVCVHVSTPTPTASRPSHTTHRDIPRNRMRMSMSTVEQISRSPRTRFYARTRTHTLQCI